MSRRSLFVFAVLVVALGYAAPAQAERLYGNYRGPSDAKSADTSQDESTGSESEEMDSSGPSGGDSGDESGGIGSGGESEGGGGGESEGGGGESEGGGGESEGGSDIGGGSGDSEGDSAGGGGDDGGSSLGGGGGPGGGGGRPGGKGGASATEEFELVSWFFEHNREEFVYRVASERNRRLQLPLGTSAAVFTRLSRDQRVRTPVSTEDRDRIFDILKTATIDKQSVVRDAAVIALGKLGTPQSVAVLLERLRLESARDVKQDTILALGLTRSPEVVEPLIAELKDRRMVAFALMGLGLTGDLEKAAPAVLEYFEVGLKRGRAGPEDLACAAMALGALRYEPAVPALAKSVKSRKVKEVVQIYACVALGRIGGDDSKKALMGAADGKGVNTRRAAVLALGGIPQSDVLKFLTGKNGMKSNADALKAGFATISAATIMEQLPESEWKKTPALIREIATSPAKSCLKSQYASVALAIFGGFDSNIRRFYAENLGNTAFDSDVLSSIAMACGIGNLTGAEPMLEEIAGSVSRDPKLASYAAMALGMMGAGGPDRARQLRKIYNDVERDDVRRGAVLSLGLVGDRSDVKFLIHVIKQPEDKWLARYTRGSAVVALGLIGDGESVAKIQELLSNHDARTRAFAITALGHLADKDETPRLPTLFGRNNFRVEFEAIKAVMGQL